MSCIHLNGGFCSLYKAVCDIPASQCKDYKHPLGLHSRMDWSTIKEDKVKDMSCKHLIWNCYCKHKQDFCERNLFPRLCEDYCREDEVEDMKKIFNKGPATNTNCACNESTADNDYVSMFEMFINKLNTDTNHGFFGLTAFQAEKRTEEDMLYLGYNTDMVNRALIKTVDNFKTEHRSIRFRLFSFVGDMLSKPHKDYANYCSTNFRCVLTLVLGDLGKLDSIAIIDCDDPKQYFWDIISSIKITTVCEALNKTRAYVEASKDNWLAEGMRMVEQWFEEKAKENIPPKELTIVDIEKQLGYKIKIVGEEK